MLKNSFAAGPCNIIRTFLSAMPVLCLLCSGCTKTEPTWEDGIADDIAGLPHVVSVAREESSDFVARFKVFFEQPLDHDNPGAGTFSQLVYVCLTDPDAANVLITEGYYAFDAASTHELAKMLDANQIVVEHRYYGESVINDPAFRYNDAESSCDDLHVVVSELKDVLNGKWISTGRSKSGLTCNMYRACYPDDVDVTIPYGSPFCQSRYDGRIAKALNADIGTPEARTKLTEFQREVLKRRDAMAERWEASAAGQGIRMRLPADQMIELNIMDFGVGFWAFGFNADEIPGPAASDDEIFNYMVSLSGPDSWDDGSDVNKYYTEAYKELGHYALPTDGLEDLLTVDDCILQDFLKYTFVPDGAPETFSADMHQRVDEFLRETDARYIFIYGSWDPWCYVGIGNEYVRGNIHRHVLPGGAHHTNISDFDPAAQAEIKSLLDKWIGGDE